MSPSQARQLKLGVLLQGGGGHWRDPSLPANSAAQISSYIKYAQIAERAKFDFGFIADSAYITKDSTWPFLSRLEPLSALSAVSSVTSRLGLVGTFTTSYSEPFTTARQLASLDLISDGRAGWNAVTSALEGVARNHGFEKLHDHESRYRIAREYIEVVKGLWDSWEDDAFVRDRDNNRYVDLDKLHTLNHVGEYFKVQGPLNIERSPQGRPVVFQAGASDRGQDLAAEHTDCIFSNFENSGDFEQAQSYYKGVKERAVKFGRRADDILVFPSINPIVGDTEEEAWEQFRLENQYIDIDFAVKYLSRYFSFYDFSQHPLDEPLPELGDIGKDSFRSTAEFYLRIAREEKLTLRQLALRSVETSRAFVGTAQAVADKLELFFRERVVDGFILSVSHANLERFAQKVVPILQERGIFRHEYEASTLRGNLGLEFPANRYTADRSRAAAATAEKAGV